MISTKLIPVIIIVVVWRWGNTESKYIFSDDQSYWSMYNTDVGDQNLNMFIEDGRDSSVYAYDDLDIGRDSNDYWTLDTVMTDWPLGVLNHPSSGSSLTNLERELIDTFAHPVLPEGQCYEYEMRYDGRIQITDSIHTLHHVWCDAPPEMSERQRIIYNRKLIHYPELWGGDSIVGKPVILFKSWVQRQFTGQPPIVSSPIYEATLHYDTISMDSVKQRVVDKIAVLRDTAG